MTKPDPFVEAIMGALKAHVAKIVEEETERAVAEVRRRVAAGMDALVMRLMSQYEVSRHEHQVVIRVDKRALNEPGRSA